MEKNNYLAEAAELRLQAAINKRYEEAILETFERTGGKSNPNMAAIHATCAAQKIAWAEALEKLAAIGN